MSTPIYSWNEFDVPRLALITVPGIGAKNGPALKMKFVRFARMRNGKKKQKKIGCLWNFARLAVLGRGLPEIATHDTRQPREEPANCSTNSYTEQNRVGIQIHGHVAPSCCACVLHRSEQLAYCAPERLPGASNVRLVHVPN